MVNNGASVPPEVPLPSAIDQEMNLTPQRMAMKPMVIRPGSFGPEERMPAML